MPHIEFPQDGVSLWYKTNLPNDDISRIDRAKPTIILIHGIFMSSEFLLYQFDDPVLGSNYNLIAFDQLSCGNTTNPMHGQHDFWVEAALLGLAHERLKLPPCHLVVCQEIAMNVELSFAILFPEKCLSLTIFTVAEPVDPEWIADSYQEMTKLWCYPESLESYEDACNTFYQYWYNQGILREDELDKKIEHWQKHYPPTRRTRFVDACTAVFNRQPYTDEELATVHQPVFILHPDSAIAAEVPAAELLQKRLVNAKGGVHLHILKSAPAAFASTAMFAPQANQLVHKFIQSLPSSLSVLCSPNPMHTALANMARFSGDSPFTTRDPQSCWSFSRVAPELVKFTDDMLQTFSRGESSAISPLDSNGKPLRKFSERHLDTLFNGRGRVSDYLEVQNVREAGK